ncbi:2277_t:CDS:1, partial [Dentiscutata heterogama]
MTNQFFSDDILTNYESDERIKYLENSENYGDFDEIKKQFLDKDKCEKESNDDHKYKSKYFQKNTNSLLIPMP